MFRPGNLGHLGRLGLVAASRPGLVAQALAILAKYGSAANLYLPGVGAISGITAGNWLDSAGTTAATVDGQVGRVDSARGGENLVQATTANKPVLRRGLVNQLRWSGDFSNVAWTASKSAGATVGALTTGPDGQQSARFVTFAASSDYLYQPVLSWSAVSGQSSTLAFVVNTATRAFGFGGATPAGIDAFSSTDLGGGWYLQTVVRTFTVTATGTLQVIPGGDFGLGATTVAYHRAALYQGTVTAQQIIDAGGIPLTTTAPASSTNGPFAWKFDGSNDSFSSTLVTGGSGWICSGVQLSADVLATVANAGEGNATTKGFWLANVPSNGLMLATSNGSVRAQSFAPRPALNTPVVVEAGWDSSSQFVSSHGFGTASSVRSGDCSSGGETLRIGDYRAGGSPFYGNIGATIIMPTVLPTASERATLRQFIASLSGVTM